MVQCNFFSKVFIIVPTFAVKIIPPCMCQAYWGYLDMAKNMQFRFILGVSIFHCDIIIRILIPELIHKNFT